MTGGVGMRRLTQGRGASPRYVLATDEGAATAHDEHKPKAHSEDAPPGAADKGFANHETPPIEGRSSLNAFRLTHQWADRIPTLPSPRSGARHGAPLLAGWERRGVGHLGTLLHDTPFSKLGLLSPQKRLKIRNEPHSPSSTNSPDSSAAHQSS